MAAVMSSRFPETGNDSGNSMCKGADKGGNDRELGLQVQLSIIGAADDVGTAAPKSVTS